MKVGRFNFSGPAGLQDVALDMSGALIAAIAFSRSWPRIIAATKTKFLT
jgi:hypothetical protein